MIPILPNFSTHLQTLRHRLADGSVIFRCRILPHAEYDVGCKQVRNGAGTDLVHVTSNINPDFKPFIPTYNEKDYVTILEPSGDGKETIIRLQLLSEKSENVKLSFTAGNPNSLTICIVNEETGESITDTVTLLPFVMRTLKMESAEYCKIKKENMLLNILMPAKVCFLKTKN